jgi:hypothetical protein
MATLLSLRSSLPRILAGGFAVAALALPAVATLTATDTATVAACPGGESEDMYTGSCVPDLVPNSPSPFLTTAGNPDVPTIGGIPCIGRQAASCVGLAENDQGPQVQPRTSVSSSP